MRGHNRMFWLHAVTPLHVGAGQGVGFIDLPIMREKVTHWPVVPGSAVKGVLRDYFQGTDLKGFTLAFGQGGVGDEQAGSLVFTDAHLVMLPVRSLYGTFAYVTSPFVLMRLRRDLEMVYGSGMPADMGSVGATIAEGEIYLSELSSLAMDQSVFLEDLDFTAKTDPTVKQWADFFAEALFPENDPWRPFFLERFAMVSDNVFNYLCETATEVQARIRINDDTKIVEKGALWYEENLPAEAVLAGVVWCDQVYGKDVTPQELITNFCPSKVNLQIGGHASVGKGQIRCLFTPGEKKG
ncbi:type III-B CRISPR module RAMP protein Cmr4 [Kyrpidia spormannii]|uniref:Type III-B CRISPR module RAMP protein Cmr4 n=1 Tax=Kyrpidia spormannii TaxID=2055160 RepID=A0A2K8N936_9BACL|nr:type III-B CRISPR module RAMP protein Cmr4 [Kyrpidia spormannii]ATY85130.1 type III-B CRISPR module RAMP protein Cmr4 [Kyrpidia spormannii]